MRQLSCKYLLCIFFLLSTAVSLGQDFSLQRYSVKDGLPGTQVYAIYEDSYGFMWIGTTSGLSRYDGKHFKNYGYKQGLENLWVLSIYEDKLHRLWVGTTDGIFQLEGNRFTRFAVQNDDRFTWLFQFSEINNTFLAFTNKGTYALEGKVWKRLNLIPGYEGIVCRQIVPTAEGSYFNFGNEIIFQSNNGEYHTIARSPDKDDKTYFNGFTRVNKRLFLSSENKLYEVSGKTLSLLINNIPTKGYFSYAIDKEYNCWINVEDSGIYFYQLINKEYKPAFYLSFTQWIRPFIDRENNIWWGSYEGLFRMTPKLFEATLNKKTDTTINQINNIISLNENGLLVAVTDKGFFRYVKEKFIPVPKPVSYATNQLYNKDRIDGYAKDGEMNTWFFTRFRHLFLWNGTELVDKTHLLRLTSNEFFYSIAVNPKTHQPFICGDSTLLVLEGKKFKRFTDVNGQYFQKALTIVFTANGTGIVNVMKGTTYLITPDKEIKQASPVLNASKDRIVTSYNTKFFPGEANSFWVANAGKGLFHFTMDDNYEITATQKITTENGLPDEMIQQLTTDAQGRKWVITNSGLALLKRKGEKKAEQWEVFTVTKAQGFTVEEWSTANFATDNNGLLWFASTDNLLKIKTSQLTVEKKIPRVVIEEVLLNMKETEWQLFSDTVYSYLQIPVNLRLRHNQNSLGIRFIGIALANASQLEYSYKLDPVDTGWSDPSTANFVSLVRLSPGFYTLHVKARDKGTEWSIPEQFSFTIAPPFWLTWWFRLSLFLLLAFCITFFLYTRIKKIKKKVFIKEQIMDLEMKALKAQMNPHFIYNALNSIQALIADDKKNDAMMYVGSFSRLLRQVLEHSDKHVIPLDREIESMKLYIGLEALRLNMNLSYTIKVDENIIMENEKIPPLILQPFIENALWHGLSEKTGERILEIRISQDTKWLVCMIEDNGVGRKAAGAKREFAEHQSKGIDITRQRLINFNQGPGEPIVFTDLVDSAGKATGTRVIARINRSVQ